LLAALAGCKPKEIDMGFLNATPKQVPVTDADRAILDEQARLHSPEDAMVALETHACHEILTIDGATRQKWRLSARILMRVPSVADSAWELICYAPYHPMPASDAKELFSAVLMAGLTNDLIDTLNGDFHE
jgi:hypothetical protein